MWKNQLFFAAILSLSTTALYAQEKDVNDCPICVASKDVKHYIDVAGVGGVFYLVLDKDSLVIGQNLRVESAMDKYRATLDKLLDTLWNRKSASAYIAYENSFLDKARAKLFPMAAAVPRLIDSIKLSPTSYAGLIKDPDGYFVISVYDGNNVTDVFKFFNPDYGFDSTKITDMASVRGALPAVLFLKNEIAKIKRPDLIVSGGNYALMRIRLCGDTIPMNINLDKELAGKIGDAARIGPQYRQHLLDRPGYVNDIRKKLNTGCKDCGFSKKETLLVYDHECQQFLYKPLGSDELNVVEDLNEVNVRYKRPLRIKVVNFNRYIYNLNLATSDISLTSQESALMQQYLIPGANNGQPSPTNTYLNSGSSNGADFVFGNIAFFKANVDNILEKIKLITLTDVPVKTVEDAIGAIQMIKQNSDFVPNSSVTSKTIDSVNDIKNKIKQPTVADISTQSDAAKSYQHSVSIIHDIASRVTDEAPNNTDPKFNAQTVVGRALTQARATLLNFNDLIEKQKALTDYQHSTESLKDNFYNLRRYCDSFIDNRITAYSLCTDDFPCCQTPLETYEHFEGLLTAVSNGIYEFRQKRNNFLNLNKQAPKASAPANKATPPAKKTTPTPPTKKKVDSTQHATADTVTGNNTTAISQQADTTTKKSSSDSIPITLNVSASDIVVSKGRIVGLTLHQLQDTTKPKAAAADADPANAIDTLWYNFEKSIPTDYIMRQIIFRNNMIRANIAYISPPIFPYGDRLGVVIQMPVADTVKRLGTMPSSTTTFSVDIPVFGKPLFSFSAGSFIGFGARRPTYEWQQVPTPGSNTIQQGSPYRLAYSGPGSIPAGLDGMANLTWRPRWFPHWWGFTNNVWVGVSGGVGVVVDQPTVRLGYLLGGTGSVGTYQQFHFTVGLMAMNVNALKADVSTTELYQTQPTIQQYNQKLKMGIFFSVSYTVFSPKSTGTMQNQVINAN